MSEVRIPWEGWELREQLGSGGFGTVYRIVRPMTSEESAMKVLSIPKDASEINSLRVEGFDEKSISGVYQNQLDRIINEYTLMAQMKGHPNVVRCEDCTAVPHADGIGWDVYLRMELLCPLPQYLMEHTLEEDGVIRLGTDLCSALALCERKGILHRDIKPENIFYSEYGAFKLGDFGIARTMDHTTQATHTGSYRYMAPEVYKNEKYGKEVDIYSLGLTLYWLLNNRRMPFLPTDRPAKASENELALQKRMSGEPFPAPARGSEALKAVVLKACAYDPRDRYSTAEELLRALEAARDGDIPEPEPFGAAETVSSRPAGSAAGKPAADNVWNDSDETVGKPQSAHGADMPAPAVEKTVGAAPTFRAEPPKQKPAASPVRPAVRMPGTTAAKTAKKPELAGKPAVGWAMLILIIMTIVMVATYIGIRSVNQRISNSPEWWEHWMIIAWFPCLVYAFLGKKESVIHTVALVMGIATFCELLVFAGKLDDLQRLKAIWEGWGFVTFCACLPAAVVTSAAVALMRKDKE